MYHCLASWGCQWPEMDHSSAYKAIRMLLLFKELCQMQILSRYLPLIAAIKLSMPLTVAHRPVSRYLEARAPSQKVASGPCMLIPDCCITVVTDLWLNKAQLPVAYEPMMLERLDCRRHLLCSEARQQKLLHHQRHWWLKDIMALWVEWLLNSSVVYTINVTLEWTTRIVGWQYIPDETETLMAQCEISICAYKDSHATHACLGSWVYMTLYLIQSGSRINYCSI